MGEPRVGMKGFKGMVVVDDECEKMRILYDMILNRCGKVI